MGGGAQNGNSPGNYISPKPEYKVCRILFAMNHTAQDYYAAVRRRAQHTPPDNARCGGYVRWGKKATSEDGVRPFVYDVCEGFIYVYR